tara:strand:+ start:3859 stop:4728 length:870 start_codon:yes stop_codon:yes gene_type:complete
MSVKEIKTGIKEPIIPGPNQVDSVNRAEQVSRKNYKNRSGNRESTVTPGLNFSTDNEINIKDLDTVVISHMKNIMKIKININNEMVDLPILYGNEERWASARKNGLLRDKNGSLILPLLMLKRTVVEFNEEIPSYKHDLTNEFVQVVRSSSYSQDNIYSNFNLQQGISPVNDVVVTGLPQHVICNYEFIIWTQYIEQMNNIMEEFISQHGVYWGDKTSYRFLCSVDGGLNDASEIDQAGDRAVKTNFNLSLKGYLLPRIIKNVVEKKRFNARKFSTPKKIVFEEKIELS